MRAVDGLIDGSATILKNRRVPPSVRVKLDEMFTLLSRSH